MLIVKVFYMLTLKEAAENVGVTKVTIQQKIKQGKLSAKKDARGRYEIDLAELLRVYPSINDNKANKNNSDKQLDDNDINKDLTAKIAVLEAQLQAKENSALRLSNEVSEWKRRHDKIEDQKYELQERLNNLLTDQSKKPKKGLLGRLFG